MDFSSSNDKKIYDNPNSSRPRKASYPTFPSKNAAQPQAFQSAKSKSALGGTLGADEKQDAESSKRAAHKLELDPLHSLSMTGVKDVPVFTDKSATIKLDSETLLVQGQGLSLKTLDTDTGKLQIAGKFFSLKYTNQATPGSFFKKLFK